jgi:hypothetical protein
LSNNNNKDDLNSYNATDPITQRLLENARLQQLSAQKTDFSGLEQQEEEEEE